MANKWVKQLRQLEGAVTHYRDPYASVIRSPSPSVNWLFANTHGLPRGYSMLLWGEPKAGKSLLSNSMTGQLMRDDPEAIVVKIDTEFRDGGQVTTQVAKGFGIDLDRYVVIEANDPSHVFDQIKDQIGPMVEAGAPIGMIIIDSITGVQGRQEAVSVKGIQGRTFGDHAQTVQIGLKSILPIQRKGKISLVVCAHARAEMDQAEIMRGNKTKAAASFGVLHHCEYFIHVERNKTKAGRTAEDGTEFIDESKQDMADTGEKTGHKIRVWMQNSSMGGTDRVGEFTVDYKRGIINQHEELFKLGYRQHIIERPNLKTYVINGKSFNGKVACLSGIRDTPELQEFIKNALLLAEKEDRVLVKSAPEALAEGEKDESETEDTNE